MKAAAQFVLELLRGDDHDEAAAAAAAAAAAPFSAAGEFMSIAMEERPDDDYVERSWAYYLDTFACVPTKAGDLLLGIALTHGGSHCWVPREHPIAQLLVGNDIESPTHYADMYYYDRAALLLGQQSLAHLFNDKVLTNQGALWESE
jgi:hypothetical protein